MAAVDYVFPWSGMIADFKFAQHAALATVLARLLLQQPAVADLLAKSDIVLPMPLARKRLQYRGYNQSLLLARHLCKAKVRDNILVRQRETLPQVQLTKTQRIRNMHNAFSVSPTHTDSIRSARVVLVDDVMTSGASVFSAANVLRQSRAAHIAVLCIARTPEPL